VSQDHREVLGKVHLFSGLAPDALAAIASITTEESHALGTQIFAHGDPGDRFFLILEGKIRISRSVPGMGEEALAVLGPGDVFGELCLFDEAPRSADARVHERCRLLSVSRDRFADLLFLRMDIARDVLWNAVRILSRRLRETDDKLTFLSISSKF
jgi:CRP/FNR family transcriptional regulator, cyclic AMP receptor protein